MTNAMKQTSKFAPLYLGHAHDVQPVYRDLEPSAHEWPEGAVMAVTFNHEAFPEYNHLLPEGCRTEYFGADGWPVDLPSMHRSLDEAMKVEFQTFPRDWRNWSIHDWRAARLFPKTFRRSRAQGRLIRRILPLLG